MELNSNLTKPADDDTPDFDHLFTPERLARIDEADSQIKAGNYSTSEQVREYFRRKRGE